MATADPLPNPANQDSHQHPANHHPGPEPLEEHLAPHPAAESGTFRFALTGDSCLVRPVSGYGEAAFLEVVELLRSADAAFTNLETLFHDFETWASHQAHGGYMRSDPALAEELPWLGFDLVSLANNHAGDYGPEAMLATAERVGEMGLVHAGTGYSLEEAREARFLDTPRGRVALVALASTFPDHARAGRGRGAIPPRPGLSPLRFSRHFVVPRQALEMLRGMLQQLGVQPPAEGDRLTFGGLDLRVGEEPGVAMEIHPGDLAEISAVVEGAAEMADYVVVSMHGHDPGASMAQPAPGLVEAARTLVERGADLVVGHGAHELRGVEIHQGKPILYGLGEFIYQSEMVTRQPAETYETMGLGPDALISDIFSARPQVFGFLGHRESWEAAVATVRFRHGELDGLTLHPVTLGFEAPNSRRGRPMVAEAEDAERILQRVADLSRPFGTEIHIRSGLGEVQVPSAASS